MPPWIINVFVALVIGILVGIIVGITYRKKVAESTIGSAEEEAKKLINEANKEKDQKRKEAVIEAKEIAYQYKQEAEKEAKEGRAEILRQERRLDQKEESMDKRSNLLEKKEETLKEMQENLEQTIKQTEEIKDEQLTRLEKIASLTQEEAQSQILAKADQELTHEKAKHISNFQLQTKDEADSIARDIVSQAIARCAADQTGETTISVVALPNDEMKGRIIGREGRNIRALETATGVDLIIDDTPEAITLSSFDAVRREVARQTLEKLISDGRIHPARIEETVEKSRRDLELVMKREGERSIMELGIHNMHPDLVKLLGRLKYRTSFGQNILSHSMEVAFISGIMAGELGVNVNMAKRAGLLHDIGKSLDHEIEGSHVQIGVDIAKKYKENPAIIHAIEAHHGDVEPKTPLAFIVMAADSISAARPGARRENVENYIKRLENLEAIADDFVGVENSYAIQAGREIRILVKPDEISDDELTLLAHDISQKIEQELDYPGQIKVSVVRENRAVDYAK